MTDFKDYADYILSKTGTDNISSEDFYDALTTYLIDNNWFGSKPEFKDGRVLIDTEQLDMYTEHIIRYFTATEESATDELKQLFARKFPETSRRFGIFIKKCVVDDSLYIPLIDFFVAHLPQEISVMTTRQTDELIACADHDLKKMHVDTLTFFLAWYKKYFKVLCWKNYTLKSRHVLSNNGAYDFEEYLELLYYLFNEDYIEDSGLLERAATLKGCADTWLFMALHFICALRNTDLIGIGHPKLPYAPEKVLEDVRNKCFSNENARYVLNTIVYRLRMLDLTPNKVKRYYNVPSVKFFVPENLEVLFGTLFALAEAHCQLSNTVPDAPLIRIISDYKSIRRFMGDDIGLLFLESDFRTRSANKSYLQSVMMFTDNIIDVDQEFNIRGYYLASLARSHKGSYGNFAHTTATYIKDAKFSGLTPEFVLSELFERGVLSFMPSILLKMTYGSEYKSLSVHGQTEAVKILDMTPFEVENAVAITEKVRKKAEKTALEIVQNCDDRDAVLRILHNVANGWAPSKCPDSLCLMSAAKKVCPYDNCLSCPTSCPYNISTKSTLFYLVSEYNRLYNEYEHADNPKLKEMYAQLLRENICPALSEALECLAEIYGDEAVKTFEKIITDNIEEASA